MFQRRVRRYSTRPFWYTFLFLSIIAGWSLLAGTSRQSRSWKQDDPGLRRRSLEGLTLPLLVKRDEECNLVRHAVDQCAFVKANCPDEEAGLLSYLSFYYCRLQHVKPLAFAIMAIWLSVLFMTIGLAASEFFCPNLSTISNSLGMSQSVAGVTFLAFGNGSPDVFSTLAAMSSHSGSLAVGELIGAASFITAVVAGSMAIVQPFKVARKDFVRDVGFFVVAVSFSMVFMADGKLHLWECIVMVCSYVFYVVCVLIWHWWLGRRKPARAEAGIARGDYLPVENGTTEVEDHDYGVINELRYNERRRLSRGRSLQQVTILEEGETSPYLIPADDDIIGEARERLLADLNSNMRVSRPSRRDRRNTMNPIRPSLVGALEFRAILSSRGRSPPVHPRPKESRHDSYDSRTGEIRSPADLISFNSDPLTATEHSPVSIGEQTDEMASTGNRPRAVSENDAAGFHQHQKETHGKALTQTGKNHQTKAAISNREGFLEPPTGFSTPSISLSAPPSIYEATAAEPTRSAEPTSSSHLLAPPDERYSSSTSGKDRDSRNSMTAEAASSKPKSDLPKREIPNQGDEHEDSKKRFSFPRFTESPSTMSLQGESRPPSIQLPESVLSLPSGEGDLIELEWKKPLRWWPSKILPCPSVFFSTLFPTLYDWESKSAWERLLGLVAAPSIFLLTITLPVVEGTGPAEDQEVNGVMPSIDQGTQQNKLIDADQLSESPVLLGSDEPGSARANTTYHHSRAVPTGPSNQQVHPIGNPPIPDLHLNLSQVDDNNNPYQANNPSTKQWNRWLVCIQIITAPLLVFLVIWANSESDTPNFRALLRGSLITLLLSLISLAVFLSLTTPSRPPRLHTLLCFAGFVVSIAWISTIAGEVVGVLKAFGIILGISDAILGLTVFAVGNSLGDLVADITVARLGYQMMAFSACFGGPMLNILLGIGCGGLYMMVRDGSHWHEHHPHKRIRYQPYQIEISNTLIISGATLLITLLGLLVWVPVNKWRMDRKIGWSLVALWTASTVCNVIVEVSGGNKRLV
ncbi:MAG: hypothetical protein M1816_003042 [Peltula sp. TS41687]|nr:MAG: hypothetical protein M1816_003042 [Peltula sp. TS41687]